MSVMTPTLLRLSQYEAENVQANGSWTTVFAQPITLYDGDTVTPYQCLIDTARPDNETIEISDDISLSLSYLYYEQNTSFQDKTKIKGNPGVTGNKDSADNELYIMYTSDPTGTDVNRILGHQSIHLPAGSYTPAGLAQYITDEFSNTSQSINAGSLATGNNLLIATDTYTGGGKIVSFTDFSWGQKPWPFGSVPNMIGSAASFGQRGTGTYEGDPYYLGPGDIDQPDGGFPNSNFPGGLWVGLAAGVGDIVSGDGDDSKFHIRPSGTSGAGTGLVISMYPGHDKRGALFGPKVQDSPDHFIRIGIVNPGTGYQRGDEVYFDYNQFGVYHVETPAEKDGYWVRLGSSHYPVTATDGKLKLVVESISDSDSYFEFMKLGEDPENPSNSYKYPDATPYWIGATEFDMEYNVNGNGLFSFNFLHTPFYKVIKNQPLQPAVLIKTKQGSNSVVNVDCGIALTALTPVSFWSDILNFDLTKILVKDSSGRNIIQNERAAISTIDNARTTGYLGLNGYLLNSSTDPTGAEIRKLPLEKATFDYTTIATTLTNPILSDEFIPSSGSGYYLIEIEGAYTQNLVGAAKLQCSAVVTRQYNSYAMVTAYEESAIPYTHRGAPITFKTLNVRILEPNSSPPTVAERLGAQNNVFLRIDRSANALPQTDDRAPKKK